MYVPEFIDYKQPISKAIPKLKKSKLPLVVLKKGKYFGLLDNRQIRERNVQNPSTAHSSEFTARAPRLRKDTKLNKIVELFFISRFSALPVVDDNDNILGLNTRWDLLKELIKKNIIPKKKVLEVMSSPAISINKNENISKALGRMRGYGVRRLVVVDDNDRTVGVISMYDIELLLLSKPKERLPFVKEKYKTENIKIDSVMTTNILTVEPSKLIIEAAAIMAKNKIDSLVVLSGKKPIGIISSRDVLEQALKQKETFNVLISGLDRYDKTHYTEIVDACSALIKKINKSKTVKVDFLSMHVKKSGHRYSIFARVSVNNRIIPVNINSYGWDLMEAIMTTINEIDKMIKKKKQRELIDKRK